MRCMIRWTAAAILSAGILFAAAVYWLFYDDRLPATGRYRLNIAAIRAVAASLPGPGPTRIEAEIVSHTPVPKIAIVAGTSWSSIDMVRASYRLLWSDRSIVLDTAYDEPTARLDDAARFDARAYRNVIVAMDRADAIVVTHEHADHMGGLITSPHFKREMPKALLTPTQFDAGAEFAPLHWPAGARSLYAPLIYRGIRAIAPGVVVIAAPGHTPGSQMIYVRRADGHEFLFMGDVASNGDNVRLNRIRSRYVTSYRGIASDRHAVLLETAALHELARAEPAITLIPGHDGAALAAFERAGPIVPGFDLLR